jgi:hypothetical protein
VGVVAGSLLFAISTALDHVFSLNLPILAWFANFGTSEEQGRSVAEYRELREKKRRQKKKPELSLHNRPQSFDDIWDLHSPLAAQTILEEELEESD